MSVNKSGLFELRDGKAIPVPLSPDPELKRIYTFHIDSGGDFWFGLDGGGLARWRNGKLARYGHQIGKAHNFIYHFGEDTDGNLWLGTRAGLIRIAKSELNAYLDGKAASPPRESFYDSSDGLRSSNFGGANRTLASLQPASELWFPTLSGLIRIDPRDIPVNRAAPPIHMQEVLADQHPLAFDGKVTIPAGSNVIQFRFAIPALAANNRIQVRYRLEPFDATWQNAGFRPVTYSRVPPGDYTFTVKAANNDGVWNEQGASIRVIVEPRFYQTWLFLIGLVCLAAAAIALLFHWRTMLLRREKENLEKRVEQRTAELSEAMRLAELAAQAKASFLATMSHEIRTPMHGVLGTLELLAESGLTLQQSEYLSTARNSSRSLLALLNDILDLSKLEAGRMDLRPAPFCLRQTAFEVIRLLEAQASLQGIALSCSYDRSLPEYFEGDEMRVRQIIFNLAGNAVKFTTRGHVWIEISGRREQPEGPWSLTIAVHDSGIGIPQDRIPQLFQDFFQVNSSASRRFAGSGLGLAICQRLAAMMQGAIRVESELGRGSTFSFEVSLPEAVPAAATNSSPAHASGDPKFDLDILLAEDNRVNQKLAIEMLKRLGCTVTVAQNGREAVELAAQRHFHLIFMDCQMPEMDGFEASRLIRARQGARPVIIALTANSLPGDRERCLAAGMNDYLAKPFGRADLVRVIEQYHPQDGGRTPLVSIPITSGAATN